MSQRITYSDAGVDTAAGDRAVELMRAAVSATHGPGVVGGLGGFAGMFDVSFLTDYERPLLATSTDGVGTKVALAQALDVHDTIGQDLVAMVVDDIVVTGARPLMMTDYIACGHVVPERIADIVRGIAEGCRLAGTALVGGETAEHPGLLAPDEYDVAGAAVGAVEAARVLGPERVRAGDRLIGLASSGLHSNGFSLVRAVLEHAGIGYRDEVAGFEGPIGRTLLTPTRIYTGDCLALVDDAELGAALHGFSHVTGGGLAANLARIIPAGLHAVVDRSSWSVPPVFDLVRRLGEVPQADLEGTLNMGIGMIALVAPEGGDRAEHILTERGIEHVEIGRVGEGPAPAPRHPDDYLTAGAKGTQGGEVLMTGVHPRA